MLSILSVSVVSTMEISIVPQTIRAELIALPITSAMEMNTTSRLDAQLIHIVQKLVDKVTFKLEMIQFLVD